MGRLRKAPVFDAVCRGSLEEVEFLLKSGKDPDATLPGHPSPVYKAIQLHHPDIAVALIRAGCSLRKPKGMSTLAPVFLMAAKFNMKEVVYQLLQRPDCDLFSQDAQANTVMHIAVKQGDEELVNILPCGKYLLWRDDCGRSPIHIAAEEGNVSMLQLLLKTVTFEKSSHLGSGTDLEKMSSSVSYSSSSATLHSLLNLPTLGTKNTPLHLAAKNHHVDVIDFLLENRAEVNALNIEHSTPFHSLCLGGDSASSDRCVRAAVMLLDAGADYTIPGLYSESKASPRRRPLSLTPLMVAARQRCHSLVKVLLERGVDPLARDDEGRTTLMALLQAGDHQGAAYLLTHHPEGQDGHDLRDVHGCSSLHYVCNCSHQEGELTLRLLQEGYRYFVEGRLSSPLQANFSPLNSAVAAGKVAVAEVLIDYFPRLLLQTSGASGAHAGEAERPLHAVAYLLDDDDVALRLARLFLSHGADPDALLAGQTALQAALSRGRFPLAELLVTSGCQVNFDLGDVMDSAAQGPEVERVRAAVDGRRRAPASLRQVCLTVVRRCVRDSAWAFRDMHRLPVPQSVVSQLRYLV